MISSLHVDAIRPSPYQARTSEAGLEELATSVRAHGIIQPIVVRPVGSEFELVAGERRWRAARLAGLTEVPAVVREMSDREAAVCCLVENLQREDLHFLEVAAGYRGVIEEFRLTQEDLARQVGRSQAAIANKLRLLRLEPEVRAIISREMLSERHARLLLELPEGEARLNAARAFARYGMSVRQAELWVARAESHARKRRPRTRGMVRDLRIVFNGFQHAVAQLREQGFAAEMAQEEEPDAWVVRLRISKRRSRRAQ